MTDLIPSMLTALNDLPACSREAFEQEEQPLPILTVAEENAAVFAQADGSPYLEEHTLRLDAYAADAAALRLLVSQADAKMTALGLRRISAQEDFDPEAYARHAALRYRCLTHRDVIYQ